tara:strand:- start:74 stop:553 length:480 start_codon:yes stop_codon:yes gene_type:complete
MSNFIENLVVDKEKKGSYLLGLQEGNQVNDIIFTSPIVRTPFGIENYKNKQNINVEFTGMAHDNEVSNFYSYLKGIEEKIQNLHLDDVDLSELDFVSSFKQSGKFDPMIRINIDNDSEIPYDGCSKNTKIRAIIKLKKIWIWNERWGLYWVIDRLENHD